MSNRKNANYKKKKNTSVKKITIDKKPSLEKTDMLDVNDVKKSLSNNSINNKNIIAKKPTVKNNCLDKTETLDVSEVKKTVSNKKTKIGKEIDTSVELLDFFDDINIKKDMKFDIKDFLKKINIKVLCIVILAFILGVIFCILINYNKLFGESKVIIKEKVEIKNDDNYVFLGDSIFEMYDLDKYFGNLPVINSGVSGNTSEEVLARLKRGVYRFNPSKVFILIGTNDIRGKDRIDEDTVVNIQKIVQEIKKNRPHAEIYVQSIYPLNTTDNPKISKKTVSGRTNENIMEINELIKKMCKIEKVTYIDMYSLLVDDENQLKLEYTVEGLHISDKGYEVITEEMMKYIND